MAEAEAAPRETWRANAWLFAATVASVFVTALLGDASPASSPEAMRHALAFTATLLSILVAHELGHYVAARAHRVPASLPFFLPLPILSPFGTLGAVIRMRSAIPTRRALLDIGAAGPLAGLCLALPLYAWGVAQSRPIPIGQDHGVELGESIALRVLDYVAGPHVPAGMELELSPVAFAAWAGMFVTMINLLPVGQLDGGHVAYALFGPRQDRVGAIVHRSMLAFFFVSVVSFAWRDVRAGVGLFRLGDHVGNSIFWLVWFEVLAVLGSLAAKARGVDPGSLSVPVRLVSVLGLAVLAGVGRDHPSPILWVAWFVGLALLLAMEARGGVLGRPGLLDHPPTGSERLGHGRVAIAVLTLLLFVLLFMPTPIAV